MRFLHGRAGWPKSGQFQAFSVLRVPESFGRQNVPVCPGPGPRTHRPGPGRLSDNPGLAGGLSFLLSSLLPGPPLGQPLAYPVLLCAGLAPDVVRDGWSSTYDTDAEEPGLVPSFLGDPAVQLLPLRSLVPLQGSQGPRSYLFSAQRVRPTSRRKPGEIHWAVYRRNRDGSEPRYYLSNAPEDTPLETLAYVGGSRWRIETEFETEKSDVGLDEYETRSWAGWHHHVALCLLGGAFLLSLQQAWGEKDAPDHEAAGLPGGAGNAAPGTVRANRVAAVA